MYTNVTFCRFDSHLRRIEYFISIFFSGNWQSATLRSVTLHSKSQKQRTKYFNTISLRFLRFPTLPREGEKREPKKDIYEIINFKEFSVPRIVLRSTTRIHYYTPTLAKALYGSQYTAYNTIVYFLSVVTIDLLKELC